jgi:hypothetical protein
MPALQFRIQLDRSVRRRILLRLSLVNVAFTVTTAVFILLWARMAEMSPGMQRFTRYVLVQGHLATENVVAAWYSSMLLLSIAAGSMVAWAADRRAGAGTLRSGWLLFAVIFALLSLDEIGSFHEHVGMIPIASNRARGWVYVLAVPIAFVGAFMLAFAWFHLRRVRSAFTLVIAGVGMFLMNPVLESIEMAMIHGAGKVQGTWQRTLHDVLQVVEEGGLELFGILCFLAAVWLYVAARAGEISEWFVERSAALWATRLTILVLVAGVFASLWAVAQLPRGDSGIAQNWFPAAAWMLVAFASLTHIGPRIQRLWAALAMAGSAICGAGLYGYIDWVTSRASWVAPVGATLAAGLALEVLLGAYFFRRSPRSSTASPTLRRPRPNPS